MNKLLKHAATLAQKRMKEDNNRVTLADVIRLGRSQSQNEVPRTANLTWIYPTKPPVKNQ